MGDQNHQEIYKFKEDLNRLQVEMKGVDAEVNNIERRLENRIKEVKDDLIDDIREVKTDLKEDIKEVKTDLRWFIGLAVLLGGIIVNFVTPFLSKLLSS